MGAKVRKKNPIVYTLYMRFCNYLHLKSPKATKTHHFWCILRQPIYTIQVRIRQEAQEGVSRHWHPLVFLRTANDEPADNCNTATKTAQYT